MHSSKGCLKWLTPIGFGMDLDENTTISQSSHLRFRYQDVQPTRITDSPWRRQFTHWPWWSPNACEIWWIVRWPWANNTDVLEGNVFSMSTYSSYLTLLRSGRQIIWPRTSTEAFTFCHQLQPPPFVVSATRNHNMSSVSIDFFRGFKELVPNFAIRDSGSDESRLPTASTCVNLLKVWKFLGVIK